MFQKLQLAIAFNASRRTQFYRLLGAYVKDGTDIVTAVADVHAQYEGLRDPRRIITGDILAGYRGGSRSTNRTVTIGETLRQYVPAVEAIAVESADSAGETLRGLKLAEVASQTSAKVRSTIQAKLITPAFLVAAATAVLLFLRFGLVPAMLEILDRRKWPPAPAFLAQLTDFVPVGLPVTLGLLGLYLAVFAYTKGRWTGAFRESFDKWVFPYTTANQIAAAGMLSSVAVMVRSGIPFSNAIERLREQSPRWHRVHLSRVLHRLRHGADDGTALAPMYQGEARYRIVAFGKRTTFHEAMTEIAGELNDLMLARLEITFAIVQFLALAAVAGLIVLAMLSFMLVAMAVKTQAG